MPEPGLPHLAALASSLRLLQGTLMKPEDFAQVLELNEWEERQQLAILPEPTQPSATHCRNAQCGEEIPEARRKAYPGTQLCVKCKAKEEQPIRGGYANAN